MAKHLLIEECPLLPASGIHYGGDICAAATATREFFDWVSMDMDGVWLGFAYLPNSSFDKTLAYATVWVQGVGRAVDLAGAPIVHISKPIGFRHTSVVNGVLAVVPWRPSQFEVDLLFRHMKTFSEGLATMRELAL